MSERSIFKDLSEALLGRKSAKPLTTIEKLCPECGNALDPTWTECSYCKAKKKAGERTSRVAPDQPVAAAEPAPSRRSTKVEAPAAPAAASASSAAAAQSSRGHTMVDSGPVGSPAVARSGGGGRRLTGVMTTFTWSRLGQLFEVRDGRNYVGSGEVSAENNRRCDIQVSEDHLLSGAHFLVLCQPGNKYIISDNLSTNGTWLNGELIDSRGVELPDDAIIKAGATVFRFQRIHPPEGGATAAPAPGEEDAGPPTRPTRSGGREDTVM